MSIDTVDENIDVKELTKLINTFLATLSKDDRAMFVSRYWFSDSISDIAVRFNLSNHNVSVKLSRIREKLKKYLLKEGVSI